jgi:hypothetical protein
MRELRYGERVLEHSKILFIEALAIVNPRFSP